MAQASSHLQPIAAAGISASVRAGTHRAEQANLLAAVLPRIEVGTAFGLRVELEDLVLSAPNPGKVTPVARTSHVCHLGIVEPRDMLSLLVSQYQFLLILELSVLQFHILALFVSICSC